MCSHTVVPCHPEEGQTTTPVAGDQPVRNFASKIGRTSPVGGARDQGDQGDQGDGGTSPEMKVGIMLWYFTQGNLKTKHFYFNTRRWKRMKQRPFRSSDRDMTHVWSPREMRHQRTPEYNPGKILQLQYHHVSSHVQYIFKQGLKKRVENHPNFCAVKLCHAQGANQKTLGTGHRLQTSAGMVLPWELGDLEIARMIAYVFQGTW